MKTAIVHDYFYQNGGAEKTVEAMLEVFPESDIFTTLYYPKNFTGYPWLTSLWDQGRIKTSFMQGFIANKFGIKFFKHFFWLYPFAMKSVVVDGYDLVMISSTYPGKNVTIKNAKKIISYCHSPSRFLHNMTRETDLKSINPILKLIIPIFTSILKPLDIRSAQKLHQRGAYWYANATHMVDVIRDAYGFTSQILFPPVDTDHFISLPKNTNNEEPYYYYFGRISFHKKLDVIIEACAKAKKRLYICGGSGIEADINALENLIAHLETQYAGTKDRIKLLGRLPDLERDRYLQGAKGFLFAGKEDFGIAPIEALASGTPIIMYKAGGALDYLIDGSNGVFAQEQTSDSFVEAITRFETISFEEKKVRNSSKKFDKNSFKKELIRVMKI